MKPERNYRIRVLINLVLFFVFSASMANAQDIRGTVLEEKSYKPLPGVNVYFNNTGIGTATNEKGEFYLKHLTDHINTDTLIFSSIGFVTKKITFSRFKANGNIVLLTQNIQLLDEVTIVSDKKLHLQLAYTRLAPFKDGVYSFGSALIGDKIFIIGGDESYNDGKGFKSISFVGPNVKMNSYFSWENYSDKLHIYDIQTDKWITSGLKFSKRAYHNINYYNNKIYILGGKRLSRNRKIEYLDENIEVYDLIRDTILIDKTNPHQAANFASFVYNDNLVVMGGSTKLNVNEQKVYSDKVHFLNLKTGYWYELNNMPVAKETKGVLIGNTIYLVGGVNLKPLSEIETYNLETGEWKVVGKLFKGVERPGLAYNDNIIYIFDEGQIQTYNIVTRELNMYSIDLFQKSPELFYANNKLYIVGGFVEHESSISTADSSSENGNSVTPSIELYSVDLNEFQKAVKYKSKILE